jgi:hypothetical protein
LEIEMLRPLLFAAFSCVPLAAGAAELTGMEQRWLSSAAPVLAYARTLKLPIDIIVQPQQSAGAVPLAMGFDGGRCKLVVSLRGNPGAEAVLAGVPEDHQGELIEAMAAHEIGHCWRYAQGAWHSLPAGFVEVGEQTADDKALLAEAKAIRENRREEGYADLVALAWTRHRHPGDYGRIYSWLEHVRQDQPVSGGAHDTRAWVKLAKDGASFGTADAPFEDVGDLWRKGLLSDE